jgi:hypothetical protein
MIWNQKQYACSPLKKGKGLETLFIIIIIIIIILTINEFSCISWLKLVIKIFLFY